MNIVENRVVLLQERGLPLAIFLFFVPTMSCTFNLKKGNSFFEKFEFRLLFFKKYDLVFENILFLKLMAGFQVT